LKENALAKLGSEKWSRITAAVSRSQKSR